MFWNIWYGMQNQTKMFERLACSDLSKDQLITMVSFLRIYGWKYRVEQDLRLPPKISFEKHQFLATFEICRPSKNESSFERFNLPKEGVWRFFGNSLEDYVSPRSEFGDMLLKSKITIKSMECIALNSLVGIGALNALENLEIRSCRCAIPPEIGNLQKLRRLRIHNGKKIYQLPTTIGKLKNLECLIIQETSLTSLPYVISNLRNLRELIVQDNRLKHLPQWIQFLTNIEKIVIGYERNLRRLPQGIWELPNLKSLFINIRGLSEIPAEICKLRNLRELIVLRSNLSTIPLSLQDLPVLERLDLSGNRLTEFPKGIAGLKNLQELCLSENNISEIPDEVVDGLLSMKNLKFFNIRDNPNLKWNEKLDRLCEKIPTCIH